MNPVDMAIFAALFWAAGLALGIALVLVIAAMDWHDTRRTNRTSTPQDEHRALPYRAQPAGDAPQTSSDQPAK